MHRFDYHVDLRQNTAAYTSETSLWPSFTDIMTVILMIFMLTMVIVIIQNTYLGQDLARSIIEGRKAAIELHKKEDALSKTMITLESLREELRKRNLAIVELSEEKKLIKKTLIGKLDELERLESQLGEVESKVDLLSQSLLIKEEEVMAVAEEAKKKIEEYNRRIEALAEQLAERTETVEILTTKKDELKLALSLQKKEHSVLEEKYNRLVGPSRSTLGKTVVTVRYTRDNGEYNILLKDVGKTEFTRLSMNGLHNRLGALKSKYGKKLYVKIIIPENSRLTYNEAWRFTQDILSRYDYYYNETGAP